MTKHNTVLEDIIRKQDPKNVDWIHISRYEIKQLSESFIREYQDYIDWNIISYERMNKNFMREFEDKINWKIKSHSFRTIKELEEFKRKDLDWEAICTQTRLTKNFYYANKEFMNQDEFII